MDLPNYATKSDFKGARDIDTFKLASKAKLASLKTKIGNLDVDKLETVPSDVSMLSNIVNNEVAKKTVYDTKIPSTSRLATETQ